MADDLALAEKAGGEAGSRLAQWLAAYQPIPGIPDELAASGGNPEPWLRFLSALAEFTPAEIDDRFAQATRHIRDAGVTHRIYGQDTEQVWPLTPLPLILGEAEWEGICAGVTQRARLMEAVLTDLYGEAQLIRDGRLPASAVTGSPDFIRAMQGVKQPDGRPMHLYAVDLGRGPDGRWWVLDDRAQAPSGPGYALENRLVLSRALPNLYNAMNVQRLAPFFSAFRSSLAHSGERSESRICLYTPGPFSESYFEQAHLARYLGFLLVEGDDLVVRDGRVYVRTIAGLKRADVLWRRVDADFIDPLELNGASRLGVPGLMEAIRGGGVAVSNMPGAGILESRALLGFLPALSKHLLGETLRFPNVATWWCGQPRERQIVEQKINDLAIAPAFGGRTHPALVRGPRMLADLSPQDAASLRQAMHDRPLDFVGQEVVRLSTTPVWRNGGLSPSPFVLRVYAAATPDGGWTVMPGGFCRISDRADARAISMGEGGVKTADVWVLSDRPVERISLMAGGEDIKVRRVMGNLPSRAADNLFWLGRYLERAEATLRLVRSLCTSLMDADAAIHGAGEILSEVQAMLIDWGAVDEEAEHDSVGAFASAALHDEEAYGSVHRLVRAARRTASGMRERLSEDFWKRLLALEGSLAKAPASLTEAAGLMRTEAALQALAMLAGLAGENMNRAAGWRFLDMGRRIERGVNTCRMVRQFAGDEATVDDLDLLLDLVDSQITYRARYLEGIALTPVKDLAMLDPYNPRSAAFQVSTLRQHLDALPSLRDDGMLEEPTRLLRTLEAELEVKDAAKLTTDEVEEWEQALANLSNAIADRYFLQGRNAAPPQKIGGLA